MIGLGLGITSQRGPRWTPAVLGSTTVLWLPATGAYQESSGSPPGTTPAVAMSDAVGALRDRSSSGKHLTQGTAARRPTIDTAGLGTGVSAIAFDGSDDRLELGSTSVTVATNAITFGIAYKLRAASGSGVYQTLASLALSNSRCIVVHVCNAGGYTSLSLSCNSAVAAGVGVAGVANDTDEHRLIVTCDGVSPTDPTSWRVYLDGVSQTVTTSGAHAFVGSTLTLGAYNGSTFPAAMNFADAFLCDTVLSAADRALADTYLAGRL